MARQAPLPVRVRGLRERDVADLVAMNDCEKAVAGTLQIPFREELFLTERYSTRRDDLHRLIAAMDDPSSADGERAIGIATLHASPNPRRSHSAGLGMWVHDEFAGRGVGTALMQGLVDLADRWLGFERLELTVYPDNEAAVALYRRFGFEEEGLHRRYARRDGGWVDALAMARLREFGR